MNAKIKFRLIAMLAVVLVAALAVAWPHLSSNTAAKAASIPPPQPGVGGCTIQTLAGYYLTAVGGGGRTSDVIHTNATQALGWEKFTLIPVGDAYALQTFTGNYVTAVGGGGLTSDVIHTNATVIQSWEIFHLVFLSSHLYAIKTVNGNYLTAVGEGGRTTDAIHSNATVIQAWEEFVISCGH